MERLQDTLRRRDIFVPNSERWGDARRKLLDDATWQKAKQQICETLGRHSKPEEELRRLEQHLEAAYQQTLANWPKNSSVRIEQAEG